MSFEPDADFENNNPFAEPEGIAPSAVNTEAVEPEGFHTEPQTSHAPSEQQEPDAPEPHAPEPDAPGPDAPKPVSGELVRSELMKLLPERFVRKYSIKITLRGIEKNKPHNPILRFDAAVQGLPPFRQLAYANVRRTYNEVVRFNQFLTISNVECFVPVIPPAATSYPPGGEDEQRQLLAVWQEWFDRVTANPILVRDEEFVYFIESDFGYAVINLQKKALVASGLVRKTLKQLAPPFDPYTQLAEFRPVIKALYLQFQKLHKLMDRKQKCERALLAQTSELSTKLKGLSHFEVVHPGMKNMWEKLGRVVQVQADLTLAQLISDTGLLGDCALCLANDYYEVKEALTNRHLIMREHLQAQAQTRAKHATAARMKNRALLDPLKADEAIRQLQFAAKAEESLHMQVKRILGEMMFGRSDTIAFTEQKLRRTLKQFALSRVDLHRRLLKHMESIRVDVRIVDERGGLLRLNRENLVQMKHNLAQSQAQTGDAWSLRTFRSLSQQEKRAKETFGVSAKDAVSVLGVGTF